MGGGACGTILAHGLYRKLSVRRTSYVNAAMKLKLYSYIGIGKYLGVCQNYSTRGLPEGTGPLNVNLGPPIISETTGA